MTTAMLAQSPKISNELNCDDADEVVEPNNESAEDVGNDVGFGLVKECRGAVVAFMIPLDNVGDIVAFCKGMWVGWSENGEREEEIGSGMRVGEVLGRVGKKGVGTCVGP